MVLEIKPRGPWVELMKNIITSKSIVRPGWQMLGALELPVDVRLETAIHAWVIEILSPFHLSAEFLNKISTSAQEAAARALRIDNLSKVGHIHLIAFAPVAVNAKAGTWGFFRIEKFESATNDSSPDHTIELYIYLDG